MDVLTRVQRHLERTGTAPTSFGRRVANDPRLVLDMRNGREPRPRMIARIEAYLARNRGTAR